MTATVAESAVLMFTPPSDFSFALPPHWLEIPADERASATIARALSTRLRGLPARERDAQRQRLRRELLAAVRDAEQQGALAVYLPLERVRGMALAASFLVSYLPAPPGEPPPPSSAELLPELSDASTVDLRIVPVAGVSAIRRLSRPPLPSDDGQAVAAVRVDYVVPVPASDAHLILVFTTSTLPVADQLVMLFDAVVSTLRWLR